MSQAKTFIVKNMANVSTPVLEAKTKAMAPVFEAKTKAMAPVFEDLRGQGLGLEDTSLINTEFWGSTVTHYYKKLLRGTALCLGLKTEF